MTPDTEDQHWWTTTTNPVAQQANSIAEHGPSHGCIPTISDDQRPEVTPNPGPTPEPTGNFPRTVTTAAAGPLQVDTTTGTPHTGAMIALVPTQPSLYAIRDGEPPDALHVTLHYLGEADQIPSATWETLDATLASLSELMPPIVAHIFGAAMWNPDTDTPSVIAQVGGGRTDDPDDGWTRHGLDIAHEAIVDMIRETTPPADETGWRPPEQHTPWVAHMCTAYPPGPPDTGTLADYLMGTLALVGPLELGTLRITRGPESFDYPLTGARM